MTPGIWRVVTGLTGRLLRSANGRVVVVGEENVVIADCRNNELTEADQRHNAQVIAMLPELLATLRLAEQLFGDLPARCVTDDAMELHARMALMLTNAGIPLLAEEDPELWAAD